MYILSIDLGTGGPKVALVGERGEIAASATRAVQTHLLPPDGAEQDANEIWAAVLDAAREVIRTAAVRRDAVHGITCASQYFSVVPVDRALRPLSSLILWMDSRGGTHSRHLYERHPGAFSTWVERHGMVPLPSGNDSLSHMLYIQHERPAVYEKTHKFLEPMDFVIAQLTGSCSANLCTAYPLLLTDNRDLTTRDYDSELLRLSGIDRDKLPDLVAVDACAGTLRADVATKLGLSPQTPVFSGINDTQAVSIGTGTFEDGHGGINVGTTSQVLAHVGSKKSDLVNAIISMPSPLSGRYLVMAENGLGGKTLDYFLRNIAFARDALADHSSPDPFAGLEAAVRSVPAGSGGVLFLPWLTGSGAPDTNANARGGFLNLSLATTRTHLVRAILEGVAYNLRWLVPAVENFSDQTFAELLFSGGAAMSDEWSQIMADVIDRPVAQLADARHVNNRATAFLAFVNLGVLGMRDFAALCPIKQRYQPRAAHRAMYDQLFAQFRAAFEQNRPLFDALNG